MSQSAVNHQNVSRLTGLAVLSAIVVVLTYVSTNIKLGPFSVTLSLVPIVIGACLYDILGGCVVGSVFSLSVYLMDPTATYLASLSFFSSIVVIWIRALFVGTVCALVYRTFKKRGEGLAVTISSIVCPFANTGFFLLGMFLCYRSVLEEWSGTSAILKIIISMTGLNFLFELAVNVILSSAVARIILQVKRRH